MRTLNCEIINIDNSQCKNVPATNFSYFMTAAPWTLCFVCVCVIIFHVLFFNYTITKKANPTKPVKNMFKLCVISKSKERNEKLHFAKRKLCLLRLFLHCDIIFMTIKHTFPITEMQKILIYYVLLIIYADLNKKFITVMRL